MRRRRATAAVAGCVLAAAALPVVPAHAADPWRIAGSGFGHGVGMSQYGAYAQAAAGRSVQDILRHYYTGATVEGVADASDVRVNLLHAVASVRVAAVALESGGGDATVALGGGSFAFRPGDLVTFGVSGGSVTASRSGPSGSASLTGGTAQVVWEGTGARSGPATLLDLAGPGESLGDAAGRYRWGTVDLRVVSGRLEAVNAVRLHDEYLYGIAEMPSSWPAAALQAQAVAARSFALVRLRAGQRAACACHVYDTTSDQVFSGWAKEGEPTYGVRWRSAVQATHTSPTTGLALHSGGRVVQAFYSSSSGGRTHANEDVWGGTPLPYLRSVDDPWSLDSRNPHRRWVRERTPGEVAAAFGLPDVLRLDLSARTSAGSVSSAVATASNGATARLGGVRMRTALGLPSTTVRHEGRRLAGADQYGTAAAVAATVHPTASTVLIASGSPGNLVDGLVSAPLSTAAKAPLLLAAPTGLPAATLAELERRRGTLRTALVLGGPLAVPDGVVQQLRDRGLVVERLGGADQYGTAALVAERIRALAGSARREVLLASGESAHLVDAAAAGGPAAVTGRPILLTRGAALPAETSRALSAVGADVVTVVGGPLAVSSSAAGQSGLTVRRVWGADQYETAAAVVYDFAPLLTRSEVVVAAGDAPSVVDAVSAGSLQRLVLLARRDAVPPATRGVLQWMRSLDLVTVVGGDLVVLPGVHRAMTEA